MLVLGWDRYGSGLVPVSWLTVGLLAFFAALLVVAARTVDGWVAQRRFDSAMDSLRAARMLALAKAGAVVGAAVLGGYLGLALAMLQRAGSQYAADSAVKGVATAAAGGLVVAAALYLERSCIAPGGHGDGPSVTEPPEALA